MLNLAGTLSLMLVVMAASTTHCWFFDFPKFPSRREDHLQRDRRIVGGERAPWTSHRYMASLQRQTDRCGWIGIWCEWDHFCGGTVIDQKWVLTAAHCFHDKKNESGRISYTLKSKEDIRVVLGARDLKNPDQLENHQNINVENIIIHQDFDPEDPLNNDIALVELASPAQGNDGDVVKATIASGKLDPPDGTCDTAGWGVLTKERGGTLYLQQVRIQTWDKGSCNRDFRLRLNKETQVCGQGIPVGGGEEHKDPALLCKEDSGGPLMCDRFVWDKKKGRFVKNGQLLKGVVSSGNCRAPVAGRLASVFTRVEPFIPWIKKKTELRLTLA